MMVFPVAFVPLLSVQYSLIVVESPMTSSDFSPSNFKSCGTSPKIAPLKILQFFPIVVYGLMWALAAIEVLSSMET